MEGKDPAGAETVFLEVRALAPKPSQTARLAAGRSSFMAARSWPPAHGRNAVASALIRIHITTALKAEKTSANQGRPKASGRVAISPATTQ